MKATVKHEAENGCRLQLQGTLTTGEWCKALEAFQSLSHKGMRTVVVDLTEAPLVDGLGLTALIAGYRLFGSDCTRFRLEGLSHQPRLLLQVAGMEWLAEPR